MTGGWTGLVTAFCITLGVLVLGVYLLKRMQAGWSGAAGGDAPLRLLHRIGIGPKQSLGLVRVADRVLVIAFGEGGTRLLTELDDEESAALLTGDAQAARPRARWKHLLPLVAVGLAALALAGPALAQAPVDPTLDFRMGEGGEGLRLTGGVGLVVFLGLLSLLPALLLLMTSFTRTLIVLQFLRPALGTQNAPPMQLLVGLSLLLTGVVMHPVLERVNADALQPLLRGEIEQPEAYRRGVQPFREFLLANTGDSDLALFIDLTGIEEQVETLDEVPTVTLVSAFVTSELRTAFQMGFLIFVPFIVVDLIVASVLMSLGMFMLPPMMVSLPFKLLLFVLADGWTLVVKNVVLSFG